MQKNKHQQKSEQPLHKSRDGIFSGSQIFSCPKQIKFYQASNNTELLLQQRMGLILLMRQGILSVCNLVLFLTHFTIPITILVFYSSQSQSEPLERNFTLRPPLAFSNSDLSQHSLFHNHCLFSFCLETDLVVTSRDRPSSLLSTIPKLYLFPL